MKFNAWINEKEASAALKTTVEANVAKYGQVLVTGYVGNWFNIFGDLPLPFLENLETYQQNHGLLITRGTKTPDVVRQGVD